LLLIAHKGLDKQFSDFSQIPLTDSERGIINSRRRKICVSIFSGFKFRDFYSESF